MLYRLSATSVVFDDGSPSISIHKAKVVTSETGERFYVMYVGEGKVIIGEFGTRGVLTGEKWDPIELGKKIVTDSTAPRRKLLRKKNTSGASSVWLAEK